MNQKEKNFSEAVYSVIDFETTGTSPPRSRAIEIGIVQSENGRVRSFFLPFID